MTASIFLGTQGWSYKSWVGTFYPDHTPAENFLAEYAKHFTCISLDLRGTGETDKPEGAYSTEVLADDVAAFMRVMGRVNWWAPSWVQRAVSKLGLYEYRGTRGFFSRPAKGQVRVRDAITGDDFDAQLAERVSVGDLVDVVRFADDLGMSAGPLMRPETYRRLFKPRHKALCDYVRAHSGMHVLIHSCGSISQLMPDLIEAVKRGVLAGGRHSEGDSLPRSPGRHHPRHAPLRPARARGWAGSAQSL